MEKFKLKLKSIVKCKNKYLLMKRWYDDRIGEPYQWEFMDMEMPFGASPDEAIIEYTKASSNLHVDIDKILYTWTYMIGDTQWVGLAYLCETDDNTVLISEEYNDYAWVTKEELADYITYKSLLDDVLSALK
ncbi:MAG: hypothetical protein E7266_10320 [Lachnospiraceae bacterium]|nr:hypothetical protein [Lachnospiraceae bacterium]